MKNCSQVFDKAQSVTDGIGPRGAGLRDVARGQAMAEAALSMVILLLLLSGIIDLGRMYFTYLALHNAAGEGAYYGANFPTHDGVVNGTNKDTILYRTQNESPSVLVNWNTPGVNAWVDYIPDPGGDPPRPGTVVQVTIEYPFEMIGPLPGLLGWNGQIPLVVRASQTVLTLEE